MPEGLVLQASLSCPLVQLEGFSTKAGSFLFQQISYIKEKYQTISENRKNKLLKSDSERKKQRKTQTKKTKIKAKKETSKKFFEESVDSKHHEE